MDINQSTSGGEHTMVLRQRDQPRDRLLLSIQHKLTFGKLEQVDNTHGYKISVLLT